MFVGLFVCWYVRLFVTVSILMTDMKTDAEHLTRMMSWMRVKTINIHNFFVCSSEESIFNDDALNVLLLISTSMSTLESC